MRPLQISPDTAVKLAAALKVPIEQLMHMPQHLLIQKLAELSRDEADKTGKPAESASDVTRSEP
ncbi:YycC family protein [Paenibacillus hodogayensis]|uniref:YycC family protein n=1 Tax=Paenibacillus hodogayensis TaxID=279208 RepID=A0ABV5VUK8_9BACL